MSRGLLLTALVAVALHLPATAQNVERAHIAEVLMRSASFGTDQGPGICYTLLETSPGRWAAYAQKGQVGPDTWAVLSSPMSGPQAGYVTFANSKGEQLTLDVLTIDTCYGITGEVRVGW